MDARAEAKDADDRGNVRRANLARVVELLHLDGPLPRAVLTERTGLNRSTIADLVGQLERAGVVEQTEPDPNRRVGRPSPVVRIAPEVVAIAANPEVDALTIAAVGLDRRIVVRERIENRERVEGDPAEDAATTARLIAARVASWRHEALRGLRPVGVGLAVPGLVRRADGLVRDAPHLRWRDTPLGELVGARTGLSTAVGNDASLGALAEHRYGAARGIDDAIYLNGGASGIGGGLIVEGRTIGGASGYAGEFGQNRPGIEDPADRRAPGGVLEDEVSRRRLMDAVGLTTADDPTLAGALAAARDPAVTAEIERECRILATALANAVNVLNPSVVVLGGFLAMLREHDPAALLTAVRAQAMPACGERLEIRSASLADDRLLIGAAELAFAPLLADPAASA